MTNRSKPVDVSLVAVLFLTCICCLRTNLYGQAVSPDFYDCPFEDTYNIENAKSLILIYNFECAGIELRELLLGNNLSTQDSVEIYILQGINIFQDYQLTSRDYSDTVYNLFYKAFMVDTVWSGDLLIKRDTLYSILEKAKRNAIANKSWESPDQKKGGSIFKKWWIYPTALAAGVIVFKVFGGSSEDGRSIPAIPDPPSK